MSFKMNDLCLDMYNNIVLVLEDEIELYYDDKISNDLSHEFVEVFRLGRSTIISIYDISKIEEGDFLWKKM